VRFVDVCDVDALRAAVLETRPGCILAETVSNPLLRVGPLDRIAEIARENGAALIVDNTFATPVIVRPMDLGAHFVVHSATKYLAGHGDVLGGVIVSDREHFEPLRSLSRTIGPLLGPFESYLTMRGIKTLPLRMERHCANACRLASWLAGHPRVERVHFPGDPKHPDAETLRRLFAPGMFGAMVSFEVAGAGKPDVFRFMNALKLVVRGTSLGDVHTLMLYPMMSSHREISPRHRERMGIRDNLVRVSVGIEAVEDIIEDLDQALRAL
jgi:cystathionine beta-lyase/cystathionine gamma-synthase